MADELLDAAKVIVVPVGIGVYRKPHGAVVGRRSFPRLGEVAKDIGRLRQLFESVEYQKAGFLVAPPIQGTFTTVRNRLRKLVQQIQARPGKRLVVLWSGHAELIGNQQLRLATSDSLSPMEAADGWAPTELVSLLTTAGAQGLYLMLDVCQAGHAAGALAEEAATRMMDKPPSRGQLPGFATLCSALPYERAKDGLFAQVLHEVLARGPSPAAKDLIAAKGYGGFSVNRLLTPAELASVMQAEFEVRGRDDPQIQQPFPASVGVDFPIFLNPMSEASPQPKRLDELGGFVSDLDAQSHFLPKARGLEPGEQGWNFTGRVDASRTLTKFIGGDPTSNLLVITGGTGVGKSAVIGRAVALSDSNFRTALDETTLWSAGAAERLGTLPPIDGIDAAVHLRGLTAVGVAQHVAEILKLPPIDGAGLDDFLKQVSALGHGERRPTVVLDALDEAEEPRLIAERIIRPLVAGGCGVVVGTRPSAATRGVPNLLELLGDSVKVDLSEDDRSEEDIADYVEHRLSAPGGPYLENRALRTAIAGAVTARAGRQFLYAKLTADDLVANPIRSMEDLEPALTGSVGQAFARTLARLDVEFAEAFTTAENGATALALGLAWGEGLGLPVRDQIWPIVAVAAAVSSFRLTDEHCRWFFRHAGAYVLESGEDQQAVYRLYHEALHEYLRATTPDADAARRRIGLALLGIVEANGGWALANPYLVRYLPSHFDGATLKQLVAVCTDPVYLARAIEVLGVDGAARVLDRVQRTTPSVPLIAVAKAVRRSRVALTHQVGELAPQLIARLGGETDPDLRRLVAAAAQIAPPIWLAPVNVRLDWSAELQTTQTLPGKVRSLAVWDVSSDPLLLVGAGTSIVTWDARYGSTQTPIENDYRPISLAVGEIRGRHVIAAGSYEFRVAVRDAFTGDLIVPLIDAPSAWSLAVAPAPAEVPREVGHQFAYNIEISGMVLDDDGTSVFWTDRPHRLWVVGGRLAVVHDTDAGFVVRTEGSADEIEFGVERTALGTDPVLALAQHLGRIYLAVADDDRTVRILDQDDQSPRVVQLNFPIRCLALAWIESETVVAAANDSDRMSGTASYVSVRQPMATALPLVADREGSRLVGVGRWSRRLVGIRRDGRIIELESGDVFTAPDPDPITVLAGVRRFFDPDPGAATGTQNWTAASVAWAVIDQREFQVRGSNNGVVWFFEREGGTFTRSPFRANPPEEPGQRSFRGKGSEPFTVSAVCVGRIDGRWQLFQADGNGVVLHDLETGERRPGPAVGHSRLRAMAFGSVGGRSLLATGGDGGGIAIWDCADWRRLTQFTFDDPITGLWLVKSKVIVETDTMPPAVFELRGLGRAARV